MHSAVHAEVDVVMSNGKELPITATAPRLPASSASGTRFVINLTSSTTPVALKQPGHPGLKRFTFFVSRRLEDGRERFRLHMGYFDSQEEAEKLLDIVREIYPGAWASVAPGLRLRAGAPAPIAGPAAHSAPAPQAALARADVSPNGTAAAPSGPITAPPVAAAPAFVEPPASVRPPLPSLEVSADLQLEEPPASDPAASGSLKAMREVLASLDDTETRAAPTLKPLPQLRSLDEVQVLKVLEPTGPRPALVIPPTEAGHPAPVLPAAAAANVTAPPAAAPSARPQTLPVAPGVRREVAAYAVQLMWSVQQIRIEQVPQLAIFGAYTLYAAEGNRDGRRWYGLRLGFFTDPISARQVAQYVRSEFSSVSVVPVTARERDRARAAPAHPALDGRSAATAAESKAPAQNEFRLLEDSAARKLPDPAAVLDPRTAALARLAAQLPADAPASRGKRVKLRTPGSGKDAKAAAAGTAPRRPRTIEETLEVLGADKLEMTQEGGELLSDSGVRRMTAQAAKHKRAVNSRIARLFERLTERMGGN